jgi:hypothetical protein
MQVLSETSRGWEINAEVGSLGDQLTESKLLFYQKYDLALEKVALERKVSKWMTALFSTCDHQRAGGT